MHHIIIQAFDHFIMEDDLFQCFSPPTSSARWRPPPILSSSEHAHVPLSLPPLFDSAMSSTYHFSSGVAAVAAAGGATRKVQPWGKSVRPVPEGGAKAGDANGCKDLGCASRPPLFVAQFGCGEADARRQLDEFISLLAQSQAGRAASPSLPHGSVAYFQAYCIDKSPARSAQ